MSETKVPGILTDSAFIQSSYLEREVIIDFFLPATAVNGGEVSL
jgi:hypothetical protein